MFFDDDVAGLRREIRMPFAASRTGGKHLHLGRSNLVRRRVISVVKIAPLPAAMRGDENLNASFTDRRRNGSQVIQQPNVLGDAFDRC